MSENTDPHQEASASTVIGINHVGLSVSNLDAALDFYTGAIDIAPEQPLRSGNPAAEKASGFHHEPVARTILKGPNSYLQLSQYDEAVSGSSGEIAVKGPGITHVCYQSPTETDIYASFTARGATPVSRGTAPISLLGQGVYYAYERDPDGIMFETEHLDRSPFEGEIWISHVALVSHDLDRLAAFYAMLFGREPNRRTNKAAGPTFDEVADYDNVHIRAAWFDLSNMIVELWQFVNPVTPEQGNPPPFETIGYNKVAFEVSDIQSEYRRLAGRGVDFLSEPVETAESTEVYARDPDGNLFSLIEPSPGSNITINDLKKKDW